MRRLARRARMRSVGVAACHVTGYTLCGGAEARGKAAGACVGRLPIRGLRLAAGFADGCQNFRSIRSALAASVCLPAIFAGSFVKTGFRVDSPAESAHASEMPRCVPPYGICGQEEPWEGM